MRFAALQASVTLVVALLGTSALAQATRKTLTSRWPCEGEFDRLHLRQIQPLLRTGDWPVDLSGIDRDRHWDDHFGLHLQHRQPHLLSLGQFYPSLPADLDLVLSGWEVQAAVRKYGWVDDGMPDGFLRFGVFDGWQRTYGRG